MNTKIVNGKDARLILEYDGSYVNITAFPATGAQFSGVRVDGLYAMVLIKELIEIGWLSDEALATLERLVAEKKTEREESNRRWEKSRQEWFESQQKKP